MTERVQVGGLQVAKVLLDFVNNEAIPGTGISAEQFWAGADAVIHDLAPKNRALLAKRDEFQAKIDAWHQARKGQAHDAAAYKAFLQELSRFDLPVFDGEFGALMEVSLVNDGPVTFVFDSHREKRP